MQWKSPSQTRRKELDSFGRDSRKKCRIQSMGQWIFSVTSEGIVQKKDWEGQSVGLEIGHLFWTNSLESLKRRIINLG